MARLSAIFLLYIEVLISALFLFSCRKGEVIYEPFSRPEMEVWLHRVNSTDKATFFRNSYTGFELDVHYNQDSGKFFVKHDFSVPDTLTLDRWLKALPRPDYFGIWMDFKNLNSEISEPSFQELMNLRKKYNLCGVIIIESMDYSALPVFDTLNFLPSFYIPTFDPDKITPEEELAFKTYIETGINESGVKTISGYSIQHVFMSRYFPSMDKLLWFLDSTDPEQKEEAILSAKIDPTVRVFLVAEAYGKHFYKEK